MLMAMDAQEINITEKKRLQTSFNLQEEEGGEVKMIQTANNFDVEVRNICQSNLLTL